MMIMGRLMEMHLDAKHTLMFIKSTWCMQKYEHLIGFRLDTNNSGSNDFDNDLLYIFKI